MPRPVAVEHPEAGLIGPVDEVMVRIHVQLVNQGGPELVNQATGFLFALPDGGETLGHWPVFKSTEKLLCLYEKGISLSGCHL